MRGILTWSFLVACCRNGLGDFRHDHQMAIQISIPRAARVDGPDHETGNGHSLSLNDYLHVCALNRTFQCLFELERLSHVLHVISKIPSPRSLQHQVQVHNDLWDPIWLSDLDMWGLIALAEAWKKIECYNWKVALTSSCLSSCRALRCTCQSISKYTCRREVQNEK